MDGQFIEEDFKSYAKTHEEILRMIEEIKEFENRYPEYYFDTPEFGEELVEVDHDGIEFIEKNQNFVEFVEVDHEPLVEFKEIPFEQDTQPLEFEEIPSKSKLSRLRFSTKPHGQKNIHEIRAATFKIRFDENGNFINVDIKKPKAKEKSESEKKFNIKNIIKRKGKGEKSDKGSEGKEEKSKGSKLKGGLGKIGKLKGVIPGKKRKKEEKAKTKE